MTPVTIEFLNYGKLTVGSDHRVPSSEGYGVTRRSRGLANTPEVMFLPAALLGIKKFDRDMIDEAARKQGGFLMRTVTNGIARVVITRSRFRPEDGEEGGGRMYQQTAVWTLAAEDWAANPAGILGEASRSLVARPDLVEDPARERLNAEPLSLSLPLSGDSKAPLSIGARMILNILLPSALQGDDGDTSEDRGIFFGKGDFPDEAAFLAAVGEALGELGSAFGRWNEISCASGIRCECKGLFIRYLPSERPHGMVDISERSIRERLARVRVTRTGVRPAEAASGAPGPAREVPFASPQSAPAAVTTSDSPRRPAAPASATVPSNSGPGSEPLPHPFHAALGDYRRRPSGDSANALLHTAAGLFQTGDGSATSLADRVRGIAASELHIVQNLLRLLHQKLDPVALGGLMDLALLFDRADQPSDFRQYAALVPAQLQERIARLKVLLPQELDLLNEVNLLRLEKRSPPLITVVSDSERLKAWLNVAKANPDQPLTPDRSTADMLRALGDRLPGIFVEPFSVSGAGAWDSGIHGRVLVTPQALLGPAEYGGAARLLMFAIVPQYISALQSGD